MLAGSKAADSASGRCVSVTAPRGGCPWEEEDVINVGTAGYSARGCRISIARGATVLKDFGVSPVVTVAGKAVSMPVSSVGR